jgi:hypothetical protein
MRNLTTILSILLASTLVHAHVGSADVFYEGDAGPYHLFVTVRLPPTIPGVAEIEIRSTTADVQTIRVVPGRLTGAGSDLLAVPDIARRSKDDPQFFVSSLWLMEFGAMQVHIEVNGSRGKEELSVPIASFARQSLPLYWWVRGLLIFFVLLLTFGIVLITGTVVRESSVPPGEAPPAPNRRRSWTVMAITLLVAVVFVYLNSEWWNVWEVTYKHNVELLKPPPAQVTLLDRNRLLIRPAGKLMIPDAGEWVDPREINMEEIIPDHGHLMHMFLIALPGMDRMWHLHPDPVDGGAFVQNLPAMPAGRYKVFADIVDKTGFPWTLVGDLEIQQINGTALTGDDSDWEGARLTSPLSETAAAELSDGSRVVWIRSDNPLKANVPTSLKFRVEAKDGSPVRDLEPYMGMAAHAEVVCSDLSVFAHIHPNGSVPMAALDLAQAGLRTHSGMAMERAGSSASLPPEFSFPYGFPHPGDYRIFVQIKRAGQVRGVAFDAQIE